MCSLGLPHPSLCGALGHNRKHPNVTSDGWCFEECSLTEAIESTEPEPEDWFADTMAIRGKVDASVSAAIAFGVE